SFEPGFPADKLPLDLGAVAETLKQRYGRGADGRIPTWGLARQIPMDEVLVDVKKHRLVCHGGGLVSESSADEQKSRPWQFITAPRIVVALNQQGMVSVGRPIQYMVKHDDGCLCVESSPELVEGVELKLTASK